ncbi:hypothetical protein [Marinoscillum pacificum]|uniref:hypothetical protein n=1 Tax=Marinoscillum pacificum TaxID=392723 RepID=UPI002156FFB4|nr:hypothetical protein [Marinoscillum pacificum]
MNSVNHPFCILLFLVIITSCNRIKNKTEQVANRIESKAKREVSNGIEQIINKIYPPFDHDQPDTENNKQRFTDFLQIEITPDIRNIYCFDDAIGLDADYMFSFNCNNLTSQKIIEKHQLKIGPYNRDNGFGLQHDFDWWDKNRIAQLDKYMWTDESQRYFKYYWYDELNEKAYFFVFDL